jgi:hypothetical protein
VQTESRFSAGAIQLTTGFLTVIGDSPELFGAIVRGTPKVSGECVFVKWMGND